MKKAILVGGLILSLGICVYSFAAKNEGKSMSSQPSRLLVIWSSADRDVALNVAFMYTHAAKKSHWFDKVRLVVWGPSAKLLTEDEELQKQVRAMIKDGVEVMACVVCADRYGVSDKLRELGIEVRGMGVPLTNMLKSGWKCITF